MNASLHPEPGAPPAGLCRLGFEVAPDDFDVCKLRQFCREPRRPFITAYSGFHGRLLAQQLYCIISI